MEGIYKVNLIPSDLSMEETVLQIANTLDNLNGIVDDVFSRVMARIKQNTDKTTKLKERIEASRTKVEKLAGMQKAIKVFSSAKYPSSIVHDHYQSIFDLDGYQHHPQKITLSGKPQRLSDEKGIQVFMYTPYRLCCNSITFVSLSNNTTCSVFLGETAFLPRENSGTEDRKVHKRFRLGCYC